MISQRPLSNPIKAGGSTGATSIALIHPGSHWFLKAAEVVTLRSTFNRLPCLHSKGMAGTVALSTENGWGEVNSLHVFQYIPAVVLAIATCQEARICSQVHLMIAR